MLKSLGIMILNSKVKVIGMMTLIAKRSTAIYFALLGDGGVETGLDLKILSKD